MNRRRASSLIPLLCVLAVAGTGAPATAGEAWVVCEESREAVVVDPAAGTVLARVSLDLPVPPGEDQPRPWGIAGSRVPGDPGGAMFVTQGHYLRVVDADTRRVLTTIDVAALLGHEVVLRGVDAGWPRRRQTDDGSVRTTAWLYLAADLVEPDSGVHRPWYVVLDQGSLLDPHAVPLLVADGPLLPGGPPPHTRPEATGVRVLGAPAGSACERAWYTVRAPGASAADEGHLLAVPLRGDDRVHGSWETGPVRDVPLPPAEGDVPALGVGAPVDRELPVFPEGPAGILLNLDTGGRCIPGGTPVAVAVAGPGPASYDVYSVDPDRDRLVQTDPATCRTVEWETGAGPVDVAVQPRTWWTHVLTADHDGDTVTVLDTDGNLLSIDVRPPPGPSASPCGPRSLAPRESAAGACLVTGLTITRHSPDLLLAWQANSCPDDLLFEVLCACGDEQDPDCPCRETSGDEPGGDASEQEPLQGAGPNDGNGWIHLGYTASLSFVHQGAASAASGSVEYLVVPAGQ